MNLKKHDREMFDMKHLALILLTCGVILAVLAAGCTAPQQTVPAATPPATPPPTTPATLVTFPVPSPISGTWTLISAFAATGAQNVLPGTTITATFSDDGTVSGSAGCNNYVAAYQVRGTQLTIGTPATTKMSCTSPAGIMNQETIYLSDLQGAASYAVNGDQLIIYDTSGKTLLTFQKGGAGTTPLPLAGITWSLELYRGSSGSNVPVIPTTDVTAFFGPSGDITGSAGCNSYTGGYTLSGQNGISIGPLATTLMYCGEPGVMDQETAYLALLRTVASYEVTIDAMLNLRNADGTTVLMYSS
jgi:heat shock protein HslJ